MQGKVLYRMHAHPPVQWILMTNPDVMREVQKFLDDEGRPEIVVAGMPDPEEFKRAKRFGQNIPLPTATLRCRKYVHNLTGERCCEVAVSDRDLTEIMTWQFRVAQKPSGQPTQ